MDKEDSSPRPPLAGGAGCSEEAAKNEVKEAEVGVVAAAVALEQGAEKLLEEEGRLEHGEADLEAARRQHHLIHFTVDGEECETRKHELTPNEIIREFGDLNPVTHYLVEIEHRQKRSFEGKGDTPIRMHDCARFQIISVGPTPVSDVNTKTGIEYFISGLKTLGYAPTHLPCRSDHVIFDYTVETGSHAGKKVRLGLVVPQDFPLTPPGGPHVSPHIHRINPQGTHPNGKIHESHSRPFCEEAGGAWQYWSRPYPDWAKTKKTVAVYMSHIWRLWDSQ